MRQATVFVIELAVFQTAADPEIESQCEQLLCP
jgi:hypothetical protein